MYSIEIKGTKINKTFIDEILGLVIIKVQDKKMQSMMMLKLEFMWNLATLDIMNRGLDTITFDQKEMRGVLDLRSLGYYKIKQGILQQNLSKYYKFESADTLCKQLNKFINALKKERKRQKNNIHG